MKNVLLIIIGILLVFSSCVRDKDPELIEDIFFNGNVPSDSIFKEYHLDSVQRQVIMSGFSSWPAITTGDITTQHTTSGYLVTNHHQHDRLISVGFDDIEDSNFEIEFELKVYSNTTTTDKQYSAFFWGDDSDPPHENFYLKYILNDGIEYGKWVGLYQSSYETSDLSKYNINVYGFNKFTVRKVYEKYYFFVNEIFMYDTFTKSFSGNDIGIINGGYSKAIYRNLKISYFTNL